MNVPAPQRSAMRLLGRRAWYLPARLRWLPKFQGEGRR